MNTRNFLKLMLPALAVLLLTSCIPSLNSFCYDKDVIDVPLLIGKWKSPEGNESLEFMAEGKQVILKHNDGKHDGYFFVRPFKLEQQMFIDLYPLKEPFKGAKKTYQNPEMNSVLGISMLQAHQLMRATLNANELQLSYMNYEWLKKNLVMASPAPLPFVKNETGDPLLTASTGELQEYVRKNLATPDFFNKPGIFKKN